MAELLTKVIRLSLHRPRPYALYEGIEQYSFPSGHALMSVVVYGFLAFLLVRALRGRPRRVVLGITIPLIALIAVSRLYLGAHWLSDVLGGLNFGTAWIAATAAAYEYQATGPLNAVRFGVVTLAMAILVATAHIWANHEYDSLRYAPPAQPGEQCILPHT